MLAHTVETVRRASCIDSVIVVVSADRTDEVRSALSGFTKVDAVVVGGATRAESVLNGLLAVNSETDIVAVHDGARPFVSEDEIARTVAKAKEMGAACLVGPLTDTIKSIRGGEISGTLDRDKLRRALTPQAFRIELLRKAFELEGAMEAIVTDESYLVEKLGHPIAFVEGSSRNIKITTPDDMVLAEALLTQMNSD